MGASEVLGFKDEGFGFKSLGFRLKFKVQDLAI